MPSRSWILKSLIGEFTQRRGQRKRHKLNLHCLRLNRAYSILFNSSMLANVLKLNSKGLHQSSGKEKESCCLLFPSSTKREIRQFHVVVVQRRQRNVQKSVMHVQSCCFAYLNLLLFLPCSLPSSSSLRKLPNKDLTIRQQRLQWKRRWIIDFARFKTFSPLFFVPQLPKSGEIRSELKSQRTASGFLRIEIVKLFIALPFQARVDVGLIYRRNIKSRLGLCDMYYVFHRLLSTTTLESWFTNLEQTPLNRSQQLLAPYKRLIDEIKQN